MSISVWQIFSMAEAWQREGEKEGGGGSNQLAKRKAHCPWESQTEIYKGIGSFFLQVPLAYDFSRSRVASTWAVQGAKPSDPDSSRCLPWFDSVHGSSSSSCAVLCQYFSDFCPHSWCVLLFSELFKIFQRMRAISAFSGFPFFFLLNAWNFRKLEDPGILPREILVWEKPGATDPSSGVVIRSTPFLGVIILIKPAVWI